MGLAQGVAALAQISAPFSAGFMWRKFADGKFPEQWPLGPYLAWNVFGLIGVLAFVGSCWIQNPAGVDADNGGEEVEAHRADAD
jgi:hypothetical protein